jgi:hypothetical protein
MHEHDPNAPYAAHHAMHHPNFPEEMSVHTAKLRLLEWGVVTDEAITAKFEEMREGAKDKARSAVPWAAGLAALAGLLGGVRAYRKRSRRGPVGYYAQRRRERKMKEAARTGGALGAIVAAIGLLKTAAPFIRMGLVYYQRKAQAAAERRAAQGYE